MSKGRHNTSIALFMKAYTTEAGFGSAYSLCFAHPVCTKRIGLPSYL